MRLRGIELAIDVGIVADGRGRYGGIGRDLGRVG
jgi:hypothetical protein